MVKLGYLEPFLVYKTTPPIIMPESASNVKRDQAYIVWAPSIESELQFLSTTNFIKFRNLTKYFVESKWVTKLQGGGTATIKPNADDRIDRLLSTYRKGNLKNIDGVSTCLPTYDGNLLKRFNVLIEVNHVFETILGNQKDRRLMHKKVPDILAGLKRAGSVSYGGLEAYNRTILIPMNLWFSPEDYKDPEKVLRPINGNLMGIILQMLTDATVIESFHASIVLVDGPLVLILDMNKDSLPDKEKNDPTKFLRKQIIAFMKKAKNIKDHGIDFEDNEDPETVEDDDIEIKTKQSLTQAQKSTEEAVVTEKIAAAAKVDIDNLGDTEYQELRQVAKKTIEAKKKKESNNLNKPIVAPVEGTPLDVPDVNVESSDLDGISDMEIPDSEDIDVITKARLNGRSVQSEKRNELLKERYKELKMGNVAVTDLMEEESQLEIPTIESHAHTINPSLKQIKGQRFEEVYDKNIAPHDLVSIFMHFSGVHPAMYLNKNIQIEDVSTRTDRVLRYTVEFEDENRKRHRFHIRLPKMYKHKYLYLNGQELTITHQKLPFPITKVSADRCQLVTNYNKIFVYRYGTALSPRMSKLKKLLVGDNLKNTVVRKGDCSQLNRAHLTTIEFDELASSFVRIQIGAIGNSISFLFDPNEIHAVIDYKAMKPATVVTLTDNGHELTTDDTLFPVAIERKNKVVKSYWLSGLTNQVYEGPTGIPCGELSDFLINSIIKYNPSLEDEIGNISSGTKFMYSRVHIMSHEIPLILVMAAADPNGLLGALEKGKIKYQFVEKRPVVNKNITGVIPFADGYLTFDRYPYENSLLLNGLTTFPSKEYNFYDMNTRDAYVEIFDLMCGQRALADNMGAFYYMMVDPITKDVLRRLNMPTDFTTLLYFCNGVLADNSYQIDSDYNNSRIRSNEIVMAHLYRELAVAWSNFRSGRTDTFSIPENAIITLLLTSKIVDPKSKLNITLELENDRNVKLKGPSGMNEDHSFTIEKRAYHPSMRGIVATNSTPSGEVGINRHMVINPNIEDARGFISIDKPVGYDGTELLSPGEAMSPFSAESADIERLCMSISQAKHLVPVASQTSCPISYDMERTAPYMSNDFAFQAKNDGKVVEITEDLMIVQYADGSYDDIDLSEHPAKNTDGGFYIMNSMSTDLKVGSKFKKSQILAYDKKYINDFDFFGDPSANTGTLARVAFEVNGLVYEDSGYITDEFAHRFATKITKQKRVILSPYANIKYIAKVGQSIQANDPILAFDDTEDEFSSKLLASIAEGMEDSDEIIATSAPVVSKFTGVIKDITITYTVPFDQMSPSLRKVVETYSKDAAKREKVLSKYVDIRDANTIVKSSEISEADSRGKVGGTKIGDGVMIDFYIEYEDVAGNGDKGSISALKFTTCTVIPTELAGYTESNEERKIDVYVAAIGAFKRMVADVEKIGILTKVLVETKHRMKNKYHDRIKAELKK